MNPIKLKILEKFGKLFTIERAFKKISRGLLYKLLDIEIMFNEVEEKKEQRALKKKEDYETLKQFRAKNKVTKKQEQIMKSKGFHQRRTKDRKDRREKRDKEKDILAFKIAKRNKEKKDEKMGRRLLESYYAVILKLIRLHYKKDIVSVGLRGLMKFVNRMPTKFVTQVLINLRSIYILIETEKKGAFRRKLKMIRTMLSLWKKINFDDQLENHFLQKKLFNCFKEILLQTPETQKVNLQLDVIEDMFVNFDNLVMKPSVSDSNVINNWFVIFMKLSEKTDNSKVRCTALFIMNKMTEKYPKLQYLVEESDSAETVALKVPRDLMTLEDKSISLKNVLTQLISKMGGDNKSKYLATCLASQSSLGKKYIGVDLRKFLRKI